LKRMREDVLGMKGIEWNLRAKVLWERWILGVKGKSINKGWNEITV
jgi:hypothetical protein